MTYSEIEDQIVALRMKGLTYHQIIERTGSKYHIVQRTLTKEGLTEPHYKFTRDDVIREQELNEIFDKAGKVFAWGLPPEAWQCMIAIMWLYGKRVSEIISLKYKDLRLGGEYCTISFHVLKKISFSDAGVKRTFRKQVTRKNPYTEYITKWYNYPDLDDQEYLFPRPQTKVGHIYRNYAYLVLKDISPKISPHLFRHSLATIMAEDRASLHELMSWFDWDNPKTAMRYIQRAGTMTQRLSDREW
jgi:integrase